MCGRITLIHPAEDIAAQFGASHVPEYAARYNISPSTRVLAIIASKASGKPAREVHWFSWGMKQVFPGGSSGILINARAETVFMKPRFRAAARAHRCLIPADGFYEWRAMGKTKRPYWITMADQSLFGLAGIFEESPDGGETHGTLAILTTTPNSLLAPIHDRMPVILSSDDYSIWLDPSVDAPPALEPLCVPYPAAAMHVRPVTAFVSNAKHEGPNCIAPADSANFGVGA